MTIGIAVGSPERSARPGFQVVGDRLFAMYTNSTGRMAGKTWLLEAVIGKDNRLAGRWVQIGDLRDTGVRRPDRQLRTHRRHLERAHERPLGFSAEAVHHGERLVARASGSGHRKCLAPGLDIVRPGSALVRERGIGDRYPAICVISSKMSEFPSWNLRCLALASLLVTGRAQVAKGCASHEAFSFEVLG
jgi:hypothetical protein